MFATKWYGVAGVPDPSATRPALSGAVENSAWNALTIVRWLMLVTVVAALGSVVLHASQRSHGTRTNTSAVLFGLGTVTAALVVYRVLIDLPQASRVIDQKLGAFLGVVCVLGVALGGIEAVAEQRTSAHSAAGCATARGARARIASRAPDARPEVSSSMTGFKFSRLRRGEWLAGGAAVVLLVAMCSCCRGTG